MLFSAQNVFGSIFVQTNRKCPKRRNKNPNELYYIAKCAQFVQNVNVLANHCCPLARCSLSKTEIN